MNEKEKSFEIEEIEHSPISAWEAFREMNRIFGSISVTRELYEWFVEDVGTLAHASSGVNHLLKMPEDRALKVMTNAIKRLAKKPALNWREFTEKQNAVNDLLDAVENPELLNEESKELDEDDIRILEEMPPPLPPIDTNSRIIQMDSSPHPLNIVEKQEEAFVESLERMAKFYELQPMHGANSAVIISICLSDIAIAYKKSKECLVWKATGEWEPFIKI